MRTTVTLEPEVEQLIQARMAERGETFKQAINGAIRDGTTPPRPRRRVRTPTYDMGPWKVDVTKALQLAGMLEDEEILRKMKLGK